MISKELVGASVRPILLSILQKGDSYGYDIIQQVKHFSDGNLHWKDGSLYPVLHRLEDESYIESYWVKTDEGRRRKYYRLSPNGVRLLESERQQWLQVDAVLARLWGYKPRLAVQ